MTRPLPPLGADNSHEYWNQRWQDNNTPWQGGERAQGTQVFIQNLTELTQKSKESLLLPSSSCSEDEMKVRASVQVFVPLCGDSEILSFLFCQCGFSVTGCDLAELSLRNVMQEVNKCSSSSSGSAKEEGEENTNIVGWKIEQEGEGEEKKKTFVGKHKKFGNQITLICDNLFQIKFPESQKFDLIYDRASAVAILPELRPDYFKLIISSLNKSKNNDNNNNSSNKDDQELQAKKRKFLFSSSSSSAMREKTEGEEEQEIVSAVYFSLIIRKPGENFSKGPPFHFPTSELEKYYSSSSSSSYSSSFKVTPVFVPGEEELSKSGPSPFVEGRAFVKCYSA